MNIIASCKTCGRQYRTGDRPSGTKFRCYCGAAVEIPKAKNWVEANVVRCSSCGSAKENKDGACSFCGADFTIHERDCQTVCPECFARIPNQSKFCSHCGVPIKADNNLGAPSELPCPLCDVKLNARNIENENVDYFECTRCAGMWLGKESLLPLIERVKKEAKESVLLNLFSATYDLDQTNQIVPAKNKGFYRKCPHCQDLMLQKNFGARSGVILDFCKEHGYWFDFNELSRIIHWVASGGLAASNKIEIENQQIPQPAYTSSQPITETHYRRSDNFMDIVSDFFSIFLK